MNLFDAGYLSNHKVPHKHFIYRLTLESITELIINMYSMFTIFVVYIKFKIMM